MARSSFVLGILSALLGLAGELAIAHPEPDLPPLQATHQRPLRAGDFPRTAERIARGRYLADAVIGCGLCHSPRDAARPGAPPVAGREYAGAVVDEGEGRRSVAPNLTPDVETGAGAWPDDALARSIREGVGHDGRALTGPMYWWAFRALSDADTEAIVAYLRTLPPLRSELPPRIASVAAQRAAATAALPLLEPVAGRDLDDPIERGRYLIEIADCMGCHTAWEAPRNPGAFAGGNPIDRSGEVRVSPNLTPDPSGLGGWTLEIFTGALRHGRGGTLHPIMPWAAHRGMTDDDLAAIFLALRATIPVRHFVGAAFPAEPCAACGQSHGLGALNVEPVLERVEADLGPLDRYAGTYRFLDMVSTVTVRERALVLTLFDRDYELVPIAGGRLHALGLPAPVSFEIDAGGAVTAMLSHELGAARWPRDR